MDKASLFNPDHFNNPWLLVLGSLISEDITYFLGLVAVQAKSIAFWQFVVFYCLGVYIGDVGLFALGRWSRHLPFNWLKRWQEKSEQKFLSSNKDDFSKFEVFLIFTRFLPGTRIPTYMFCGFSGYSLAKFSLILIVSTISYTVIGGLLAYNMKDLTLVQNSWVWRFVFAVLIVSITSMIFKVLIRSYQFKLKYREIIWPWKVTVLRRFKPEFAPVWRVYWPLFIEGVVQLFKYRSFKTILAVNPSIYMSGLVGEKKSDIDHLIKKNAPQNHLQSIKLESNDFKSAKVQVEKNNIRMPFILKPDHGLRGHRVRLVRDMAEFQACCESAEDDCVIQKFTNEKSEWGIFYIRKPGEEKGKIFSITEKVLPFVVGDGESSLYQLVKKDPMLLWRFDYVFDALELSPFYVPQKDEKVLLVFRGSHSKGCYFFDREIVSAEVEKFVEVMNRFEAKFCGFSHRSK